MDKFLVAVYGTLKKGRHNHPLLRGSNFLGYCRIPNGTLYVGELPYLTDTPGNGCDAELYEVSEFTRRMLDMLEGHPDFYERRLISVTIPLTATTISAWCYFHPDRFNGTLPVSECF